LAMNSLYMRDRVSRAARRRRTVVKAAEIYIRGLRSTTAHAALQGLELHSAVI